MDKKILYGIIAVVIIAGIYVYLNPAILGGNNQGKEKDFKTAAEETYDILKANDVAFETLTDEKLSALDAQKIDAAETKLEDAKTKAGNAALKDLADLYIAFLEESKIRKELLLHQATIDKLSGKGVCTNIETLDKALGANDLLYNALLENNKKIEEYAQKYPKEAESISLENFLEDEDEAFINYYELKDYILNIEENCVNLGEGYLNEE